MPMPKLITANFDRCNAETVINSQRSIIVMHDQWIEDRDVPCYITFCYITYITRYITYVTVI